MAGSPEPQERGIFSFSCLFEPFGVFDLFDVHQTLSYFLGFRQPSLHINTDIVPCNAFECHDSFDDLLDKNGLDLDSGFRILSWISAPFYRSLFYWIRIFTCKIGMLTCRSVQAVSACLDLDSGFRILSCISAPVYQSFFYCIRIFTFKIGMLTCRFVQAVSACWHVAFKIDMSLRSCLFLLLSLQLFK